MNTKIKIKEYRDKFYRELYKSRILFEEDNFPYFVDVGIKVDVGVSEVVVYDKNLEILDKFNFKNKTIIIDLDNLPEYYNRKSLLMFYFQEFLERVNKDITLEKVIEIRKKYKISQEELSKVLDMREENVCRYEKGRFIPKKYKKNIMIDFLQKYRQIEVLKQSLLKNYLDMYNCILYGEGNNLEQKIETIKIKE